MDSQSQRKVIDAGFTIIRIDNYPSIRIKFKDIDNPNWVTYETFPTKASRDRVFKDLLQHPKFIQD